MTLNELRANSYWITGGSYTVAHHISDCVPCQKLHGSSQEQKMADLPLHRLEPTPPFTHCKVDYFGLWSIKEGRCELKRYSIPFTCVASQAVHLKVAKRLETGSFINLLHCFLARHGLIRVLRLNKPHTSP